MPDSVAENPKAAYRFGPGLLVTAAFIGPGTVVTASKAGAGFSCELLWTILFASIGAIILQLLAARLGIVTKSGLGSAIRQSVATSAWLIPVTLLVVAAIGVGNAAYQTGNLTGAASGIQSIAGGSTNMWVVIIAVVTAGLLLIGRYKVLQSVLIGLVLLLSVSFLGAAIVRLPPAGQILAGLLIPRVSIESLTLVVALIGTTIVPYNLFLHSSAAADCWRDVEVADALRQSRWDTVASIALGGFVTAAILVTASAAFADSTDGLAGTTDIADQLRPALGDFAGLAFALGLFAAGITSSITAPLATGYAVCGILGWKPDTSSPRFRAITLAVLLIGALFAIRFGKSPVQTIVFSQLANGILLPVIALFLIVIVTRQVNPTMRQGKLALAAGWMVVIAVSALGIWRIYATIQSLLAT
ncbi:MAG: divalent metal cation transporter [Pirellulaceae bacterium]|nr:divalent metal cation transporter [Pirellulaceae bacterium]